MALKLNGSSSGYVAIEAPAAAGSNTLTLPTSNGSANQYLKNGSTPGTLEFASLSAGGKILQVKDASYSTSVATQNAAMVDTGLSCQIDSVASGSRILIIVNQAMRQYRDRSSTNKMGFGVDIVRTPDGGASTVVLGSRKNDNNNYMDFFNDGDAKNDVSIRWPMVYVDTPGVTGTIVYKTMMASGKGSDDSAQIWAQGSWESQTTAPTSTMTLMEIGS